jgi:hypothetical protein
MNQLHLPNLIKDNCKGVFDHVRLRVVLLKNTLNREKKQSKCKFDVTT